MPNEILKEIFELVLAINEEGKYQVFLSLSPHVSLIDLRIFEGSWKESKPFPEVIEAKYEGSLYNKGEDLEAMRDRLYQIYLEGEV